MQMNPSIILAGTAPDVMGQFGRGMDMAQTQRDNQHTNGFRAMLQQNGAGIMGGEQNALAALAQYDPQAALGVQQTRQSMAVQREQLDMARASAARAAASHAAQMSAADRAREADTWSRGVSMLTQAQTPEQFAAVMQMPGVMQAAESLFGPGVATFENRNLLIAGAMGVSEALQMAQGPQPDFGSTPQGYVRIADPQSPAGARFQQIPGGPVQAGETPTVRNVTLSDGSEVMVQYNPQTGAWDPAQIPQGGTAGTGQRVELTESQATRTLFQSMQNETSPILNQIEQTWDPSSMRDAAARTLPIGGGFFQSREGQVYGAASRAWAEGALRIATGAAATQDEIDRTVSTYFAQPGDTPDTVAFKAQLREMYARSIRRSLGEASVQGGLQLPWEFAARQGGQQPAPVAPSSSQPRADMSPSIPAETRPRGTRPQASPAPSQADQQAGGAIPAPPAGIAPEDWQTIWPALTPEEQRLFQ